VADDRHTEPRRHLLDGGALAATERPRQRITRACSARTPVSWTATRPHTTTAPATRSRVGLVAV
jgi:hypothetical protein